MKIKTHKPNSVIWIIALVLFLYALAGSFALPLPYSNLALIVSAALLLLGTTVF